LPGGPTFLGRTVMAEDLESDLHAHTKMHPTNIIASKDITVFEFDIESPREDPFRCPPAATQVHFQRDGLTHRMHVHFAPHPRRE